MALRLDSSGRDVTDLPGLWSEDDKIVDSPTMNKIEGIPDGWELVRIGSAKAGDYRLSNGGVIMKCGSEWCNTNNVIIRQVDDSKLIAAATELLDACKLALKDLTAWGIYGPGRTAIQAAIKKAVGELE